MTIEDKIKALLVEHGMFPDQAAQVIKIAKADKVLESMARRWGDQVDDYPKPVLSVLWMSVKGHALEWIDENLPKAWYHPMFAGAD